MDQPGVAGVPLIEAPQTFEDMQELYRVTYADISGQLGGDILGLRLTPDPRERIIAEEISAVGALLTPTAEQARHWWDEKGILPFVAMTVGTGSLPLSRQAISTIRQHPFRIRKDTNTVYRVPASELKAPRLLRLEAVRLAFDSDAPDADGYLHTLLPGELSGLLNVRETLEKFPLSSIFSVERAVLQEDSAGLGEIALRQTGIDIGPAGSAV